MLPRRILWPSEPGADPEADEVVAGRQRGGQAPAVTRLVGVTVPHGGKGPGHDHTRDGGSVSSRSVTESELSHLNSDW